LLGGVVRGVVESIQVHADIMIDAEAALSKVRRRLLPFLFTLYIVAYLDRINVGFAALQMNREIGLSQAAFGFGAGIFFLGYFIFEIPSNLLLRRVGARRWIARIMVSWGVTASAMMFVRGAASFYVLRFMLGLAEAGFFPGIIYYLTFWFPHRERARAIAWFMTATSVAGVIAGPLSGALLTLHGIGGLSGWQWMFLLEGVPAVVMGIAVWRGLPDRPAEAMWLTPSERDALMAILDADSSARKLAPADLSRALLSGRVWTLTLFYFLFAFGLYGISFWLPQILKGFGTMSVLAVGFASTIPFAAGGVAMVLVGRSSDRLDERRIHLALCAVTGAVGFFAAAYARGPVLELACITVAAAGTSACVGPFWAIPAGMLTEAAAAGGIALINSVGNLGGFVGPYLAGFLVERTDNFATALLAMGTALALASVVALAVDNQIQST
jgi:ACS family tartrate transporter-like MFS transporter